MYKTCVLWYFQLDNGDPQGQYIQDEEPSSTNCQNCMDSIDVCTSVALELKLLW